MADAKLQHWVQGNTVILAAGFEIGGAPTDAIALSFFVKVGDTPRVEYELNADPEVSHPGMGEYECVVDGTVAATYQTRVEADFGNGIRAAEDHAFVLDPSQVTA